MFVRNGLLIVIVLSVVPAIAGPAKISEIAAPEGYGRAITKKGSYSRFVQNLALKKDNKILTWDGRENRFQGFDSIGVLKLPLLYKQDLEQCADWAMRLWSEHHKASEMLNNWCSSTTTARKNRTVAQSYEKYLRLRMAYSNSHSLKKGTKEVMESELLPGDLIVQNETGGIGHVSVIMNVAASEGKPDLYLIGFSFMPAQEFHIERAPEGYGAAGWFTLEGFKRYLKERFDLGKPVLRRF